MKVKKIIASLIVLIMMTSNFMPIVFAVETIKLTCKRYKVDDNESIVYRVEPETTLQEFKKNFYDNQITVYTNQDKENEVTTEFLGTGMVLEYSEDGKTRDYQISVIGDLDGNGKIEQIDFSKTIRYIVEEEGVELKGIEFYSADISGDGIVDQRDIRKYIKYISEGELDVDLDAPVITIDVSDKTENSIKVLVTTEDNGEGLEENPIIDYYIKEADQTNYEKVYSGEESTYEFVGLEEDKEYNIKVTAKDKAGNEGEKIITVKTVAPERDEVAPEVTITVEDTTSNSITISVNATDDVEMPEIVKYKYYIKNGETYTFVEETADSEYTFNGLTKDVEYQIKVETKDNAGNTGYAERRAKTGEIPGLTEDDVRFEYDKEGYTNDAVVVTVNVDKEGYTVQTSKDGVNFEDTNTQEYTENGTIYVRLVDENGQAGEVYTKTIDSIDKLCPTGTVEVENTSRSLTVKVNAQDQEANATNGKSGIKGYYYSIDNGENFTEMTTESNYVFDNLPQATEYEVKVKVEDNAGNAAILNKNTQTETIPTDAIVLSDILWDAETHEASVIVNTSANGYTLQYAVDRNEWIDIDSGTRTEEYPLGTTIYARLYDGINESSRYASIKIADGIAPTAPVIEIVDGTEGENNWYTSNVTVKITEGVDNESGRKNTVYTLSGAMTREETEVTSEDSIIIKKNGETTVTAYTYDNAGNVSEASVLKIYRESNKPQIDEVTTTSSKIKIKASSKKAKINGYTITRNSTVPTEFTPCNPTYELNVEVDNNLQSKDYYVWVKDEAGNISDYEKVTMQTIPINTITIKDVAWNKNSHKACVTIETTTTGYMMQYSTDKENWIDITSGNKTQEYDVNTTIYARLFDGTNESLDRYESFKIRDSIAPTSPTVEVIRGTEGLDDWYTSDVEVKITEGVDIQCGVNRTTYILEGAEQKEETTIESGDSIVIANDGITKITVYTYDNVGNRSNPTELTIKKDATNPTKANIDIINGTEGINGWYVSEVKVQITSGTDATSEVAKITYVLEGDQSQEETEITSGDVITIVNNGITTIKAYTYDNAGNRSEEESIIVKKDEVNPSEPSLTIVNGTEGINGWHTSNVEVKVTSGTDEHSNIQKITYVLEGAQPQEETVIENNGIITITEEGITKITAYTYDNSGNRSNPTELTIKKDATNPTKANIDIINGTEGINGWYVSEVKVQITSGTDATSEVAKITYVLEGDQSQEETEITSGDVITIVNNGITTIKAYTYDNAGNRSEEESIIVKKDEVNPSEPSLTIVNGTEGINGWHTSNVEVKVTSGTDEHSNIQKITYVLEGDQSQEETVIENNGIITITEEGITKITAYTYDNSGNRSNPTELTIKKDATKPVVKDETSTTTNSITIVGEEATSGIIGYTITEDETEPTSYTECTKTGELEVTIDEKIQKKDYYVWLKDEAGNVSNYKKVTTKAIPTGTITIDNIAWNPNTHNATVTVTTTAEGFRLQYSIDQTNWTDILSGTKTDEYPLNTIVYARLFDGTNEADEEYTRLQITDGEVPTMPDLEIVQGTEGTNGWYTSNVNVKVTFGEDHQSNVDKITYTLEGAMTKEETEIANEGIITISTDGITTITAYVYDLAGNRSEGRILQVKKDETKPVVINETSRTTNSITIRATDNMSGIIAYAVTETAAVPTSFTDCVKTLNLTAVVDELIQSKDYYVWVKDEAGLISVSKKMTTSAVPTGTLTIDSIIWNPETHKACVRITTTAPDYTIQYSTDRTNWREVANGTKTDEYPLNTIIYARLWDGLNESTDAYANLKITDGEKPNAPTIEVVNGTLGDNDWYTSNITIKVTEGVDNQSGVQKVSYVLSGAETKAETVIANEGTFDITTDGETTITAYTYDYANNKSVAGTLTVKKDATKPVVGNDTTVETDTVIIKASDVMSGIVGYTVTENTNTPTDFTPCLNTKQLDVTVENRTQNKDYYVWVKDEAGNVSIAKKVTTTSIPTGTITLNNIAWNANTHKATVTISSTANGYKLQYSTDQTNWKDITNGGKTEEYPLNTVIYARLWDGLNEANEPHPSITITDTQKPTSPTIQVTSGTMGNNNWYTSNVTIKITTGEDYQSNVNRTTYILTGAQTQTETTITSGGTFNITTDGETLITAYTYDNAGNKSAEKQLTIRKDSTKPVVNADTVASSNKIKISAKDATSGVVGYTVTESTTIPSSFTECGTTKQLVIDVGNLTHNKDYYVWVKDAAGNISDYRKRTTIKVPDNKINVDSVVWNPETHEASVIFTTTETDYTLQYSADQTNWTDITSGNKTVEYALNTMVYARLWDGNNNSASASVKITDSIKPELNVADVETNSFRIIATDNQSGINGYQVTETNTQPSSFTSVAVTNSLNQEITNRAKSKTYYVWVRDVAGNVSSTSVSTIAVPAATIEKDAWDSSTGQRAKISANNTGYTIQYSTNNSTWTSLTGNEAYTPYFAAGTTIYARLWDGNNGSATVNSVTITKEEGKVVLSAVNGQTMYPDTKTFTVTQNLSGGTLSVATSNSQVATASISGNTVTVTPGTKTHVIAAITVTSAETYRYNEASAKYSIVVDPRAVTAKVDGYEGAYDANFHGITVSNVNVTGYSVQYYTSDGSWTSNDTNFKFKDVGTHLVVVKIGKAGYEDLVVARTIIVNPKEVSAVWGNTTFTYNGNPQGPTATANSGITGQTINVSVTGQQTNAGTYTATASIASVTGGAASNYKLTNTTCQYTINKKAITPTVSMGNFTYGQASVTGPSVSGNPGNGGVTYSYKSTSESTWHDWPSTLTSTSFNAGTYNIRAVVDETGNYLGNTTTGSFTVSPKSVAASWTNTTLTYTGGSQAPTASATGVTGETINLTVTGHQTNAGNNYTASASIASVSGGKANKNNYTLTNTSTSYVINPKSVAVSWTNTTLDYNGSSQGPTASVSSGVTGETINLTVTGQQTNAGTYTASTSMSSVTGGQAKTANYTLTNTSTSYTIRKINLPSDSSVKVSMGNYTYGQSSVTGPSVSGNVGGGNVTYSYKLTSASSWTAWPSSFTSTKLNAGTYDIKAHIDESTNYYAKDVTSTFTVSPKSVAVSWSNTSLTYNGSSQGPSASATGVTGETINLTVTGQQTNAGSHTASASISSVTGGNANKNNYTLTGTSTSYTIGAKSVAVSWSNTSLTYTGGSQGPTASATGINGETINLTVGGKQTNAGTGYTATASISSVTGGNAKAGNYTLTGASTTYSIGAKSVAVSWTNKSLTYTGGSQGPTASATGINGETINLTVGGKQTNAGTGYTATASISSVTGGNAKAGNYTLTGASTTYSIGAKSVAVSWTNTSLTYTGGSQGPTASATGINGETINLTVGGKQTNAGTGYTATASISSVTGGNAKAGNYTLTGASTTYSIGAKSVAVSWTNTTLDYNGSSQGPTASASGVSGETINLTVSGKQTNAGSYIATASISSVTGGQASKNNYTLTNTSCGYTIRKINLSNPSVSKTSYTYGQSNVTGPSVSGNTGNASVTYYYKLTSETTWHNWPSSFTSTSLNAGSYNIKAHIYASTNYNEAEVTNTFTVYKASRTDAPTLTSVSKPYNSVMTIYSIGVTGNGTEIQYRTSTDNSNWGSWTSYTPSRACNASGITYVQARYAETTNYNATSSGYYSSGYIEIGNFGVKKTGGSETYFYKLADAIGYLSGSTGTITMYRDASGESAGQGIGVASNITVILDMNGHTLNVENNWFWNYGNLTIKDGTIINGTAGSNKANNVIFNDGGSLNISNVTIKGGNDHVLAIAGGNLYLSSVSIQSQCVGCWALYVTEKNGSFGTFSVWNCDFDNMSGVPSSNDVRPINDNIRATHAYHNCYSNDVKIDMTNKTTYITNDTHTSIDHIQCA